MLSVKRLRKRYICDFARRIRTLAKDQIDNAGNKALWRISKLRREGSDCKVFSFLILKLHFFDFLVLFEIKNG